MDKRLLVMFAMIAGLANAQPQLSVVGYGYYTDSTSASPTQFLTFFDLQVSNTDSFAAFSGNLWLGIGIEDPPGTVTAMTGIDVGFYVVPTLDTTVVDTALFPVDTSLFKEGNNTVVIWPLVGPNGGAPTIDSLFITVFYTDVSNLINNDIPVKIGPNPAGESVYLFDPGNLVKRVRIRTVDGRLMCTANTNALIWLGGISEGVYIVELETTNGLYSRKLIIDR